MKASQVKYEFPRIERCVDNAAQLCQLTQDVPDELRRSLGELDKESAQAGQLLQKEQNDNRILECIDRLEKLGDRAMHVCRQAGNSIDDPLRNAIQQAHDQIASLKHRLH